MDGSWSGRKGRCLDGRDRRTRSDLAGRTATRRRSYCRKGRKRSGRHGPRRWRPYPGNPCRGWHCGIVRRPRPYRVHCLCRRRSEAPRAIRRRREMTQVQCLFARPSTWLLVAALLSACTVAVDHPRPVPPRPQACTFQHAPVCGRRGERLQTFGNACMARAQGFRVVSNGQCRISRPTPPIACTREFAPVCASRGGRLRTFSNACLARADGFRPVHAGRCR
ncbi:Kazal-type serine protease inhibitor domain-containing protein [Mesorhizobium calcicola]|uniref:Kazal-type serine protease inhibitor domain-containing protein n=1 Tax=Mesorhizobium calcicola TaxID=1300310 RepID=A0ABW4WBQ2_9HYPH